MGRCGMLHRRPYKLCSIYIKTTPTTSTTNQETCTTSIYIKTTPTTSTTCRLYIDWSCTSLLVCCAVLWFSCSWMISVLKFDDLFESALLSCLIWLLASWIFTIKVKRLERRNTDINKQLKGNQRLNYSPSRM
jgi:hypothetical protein